MTITFGDVAENGPGMEHVFGSSGGPFSKGQGLNLAELEALQGVARDAGFDTQLLDLVAEADLPPSLVIRRGVGLLTGASATEAAEGLLKEQAALSWDSKALMRGVVKQKRARHNLCYADFAQEPDYPAGKGRVVPFASLPWTARLREGIGRMVAGGRLAGLPAEGNFYYDASQTGIGFHGDGERRVVIAARLGVSIPLRFLWFRHSQWTGRPVDVTLHAGDVYLMSEKAVGNDWRHTKDGIFTLRHAAGCPKYTALPPRAGPSTPAATPTRRPGKSRRGDSGSSYGSGGGSVSAVESGGASGGPSGGSASGGTGKCGSAGGGGGGGGGVGEDCSEVLRSLAGDPCDVGLALVFDDGPEGDAPGRLQLEVHAGEDEELEGRRPKRMSTHAGCE